VHVHGSTGDDAGQAMAGGLLRVDGHAGDRLASAAPGAAKGVTGGEIVVLGTAGDGAAALMRRGLVAVAGGVGPFAGRGMIAGTLLVLGPIGDQAGLGNKRGSIIAGAGVTVPPTYRLACTYEPPHVRLLLTSLGRRFAFPADADLLAGPYDRYCGDAGEVGKGEILAWTGRARSPRG
jgi:formylmethanofuran dehydrogenase subunit C